MNSNFVGNYIAGLKNYKLEASTPGTEQTVLLKDTLPAEILQSLNNAGTVQASLGCRKDGLLEMVTVVKGSYNAQDKSIRIIRGQSAFAQASGGRTFTHAGNNIHLDFSVISPTFLNELALKVDKLINNPTTPINNPTAIATKNIPGRIETTWDQPNHNPVVPYKVIPFNEPNFQFLISQILNVSPTSNTMQFDGAMDTIVKERIERLSKIINAATSSPARTDAVVTWLNTLAS